MKKYLIFLFATMAICGNSCEKSTALNTPPNSNRLNSIVSTIAGDGTAGFVDGSGLNARFNGPFGVTVSKKGFIYVADEGNNCIRVMTPSGDVRTYAGTGVAGYQDGPAAAAQFNGPDGVAADDYGNLFVADVQNECIRKIDTNGVVSTVAGMPQQEGYMDGPASIAQFGQPTGIAFDPIAGRIYVADAANYCIRRIDANGNVSTLAGNPSLRGFADGTGKAALFNNPQGVAVDPNGNVFVADVNNNRIRRINYVGVVTTLAGDSIEGYADGNGKAALFAGPTGVGIDPGGTIYVADAVGESIRMITPLLPYGVVQTVAGTPLFQGSADGIGSNASFANPTGVAYAQGSVLYVADYINNRIRKIKIIY